MGSARIACLVVLFSGFGYVLAPTAQTALAQQTGAQPAAAIRLVGSITAIAGKSLTVKPDSGAPTTVTVADTARILETAPGVKTVAGATPIQFKDLAVGDRVLALVHPATDGSAPTATILIVMTQADIAKEHAAEEEDWQRRGIGGIVKTVDPATGTVTISTNQSHILTIHTTPKTVVRRYSPESTKFSDAILSTLDQIHPGDQLRALGDRNADDTEMQAEKMVAGSFRNIAGTVVSTNRAANTVTVTDLATKKPVTLQVDADSEMHKLPDMMAQALAARFKSGGPGGAQGTPGAQGARAEGASHAQSEGSPTPGGQAGQGEQGYRRMGAGGGRPTMNVSQLLQRTPVIQLADLHKGDAVMIVATQGTAGSMTLCTLLANVEPILRASSASQNLFSASWDLGGQGGASAATGGGESEGSPQ